MTASKGQSAGRVSAIPAFDTIMNRKLSGGRGRICCACSKKCSALQWPESRFGNPASTGKGTVGPVWGWWLVWELAGSRCDREESRQAGRQAGRAARERWAEITEMSWPGVEEECRRRRNDHAHEDVIVQANGRIMLPFRVRVASNSNSTVIIPDALAASCVTHRTEPLLSTGCVGRLFFCLPANYENSRNGPVNTPQRPTSRRSSCYQKWPSLPI